MPQKPAPPSLRYLTASAGLTSYSKTSGGDDLPKAGNSPYYGSAVKCLMYIDKLKEEGDDLLWKMTSESPVYIWIMEDAAGRAPFIARIKIENTPLGEMNVYTTKIEVTNQ